MKGTLHTLQENMKKFPERNVLSTMKNQINSDIRLNSHICNDTKTIIDFYTQNDNCPTCKQSLHVELKGSNIQDNSIKLKELEETINTLNIKFEKVSQLFEKYEKSSGEISTITHKILMIEKQIQQYGEAISMLQKENCEIESIDLHIAEYNTKISEINDKVDKLLESKQSTLKDEEVLNIAQLMLKDGGIKTSVIKKFIPILNQKIAENLEKFNFPINFEFKEDFTESVKSPYREVYSYSNFSEGEKSRINIALLFAFRDIARLKNIMSFNLLVLDEIFDSSLDSVGSECLTDFLIGLDKCNVFVISHSGDKLYDKFHGNIRLEKRNNFTRMI
jgi:DNA repair exonuclease SbcCD ATPase subunit